MDITQIPSGKECNVVKINGGYGLVTRLESLGIRVGVKIKKVSSQFMSGPVVIQIGNTQVAIGFDMAKKIIVESNIAREYTNDY